MSMPLPTSIPMSVKRGLLAIPSTISKLKNPMIPRRVFHTSAFSTNPNLAVRNAGWLGGTVAPGGALVVTLDAVALLYFSVSFEIFSMKLRTIWLENHRKS